MTIDNSSRRTHRRLRRWGIAAVVLLALYALGGFLGVPWIAARYVVPAIDDAIRGTLRVDSISCNPFTATIEIGPGVVRDPDGAEFLAFDRVRCNFDPVASLATGSWRFAEVTVEKPSLRVSIEQDGQVNLIRALSPPAPGADAASTGAATDSAAAQAPAPLLERIPRVIVAKGSIVDASLRVEDRWIFGAGGAAANGVADGGAASDRSASAPFLAEWSGASFDFGRLDLEPLHRSTQLLSARTPDGAKMEWQSSLVTEPPAARGILRLRGLPIAPFMPYLTTATTARIVGGTLDFDLQYELAPTDSPPIARVRLPSATLASVRIMDGDTLLLDGPHITLIDTHADLAARRLVIPSLRLSDAQLHLVRDANGQPALLRLFPWAAAEAAAEIPSAPSGAPGAPSPDEPVAVPDYPVERVAAAIRAIVRRLVSDWDVTVQSVGLHQQTVRFTDLATRRPVEVGLEHAEITAGPISSAARFALPFELEGALIGGGTAKLAGTIKPLETEIDIELTGERVALAPFAPYIPERPVPELGAVELREGFISGDGRVTSSIEWAAKRMRVGWNGRGRLDRLRCERAEDAVPIALVESAITQGALAAEISPAMGARVDWKGRAEIDRVAISAPFRATPAHASIERAEADGELLLHHASGIGSLMRWKGVSSLTTLTAKARSEEGADASLEVASLGADGELQAEAPPDGSTITASHKGSATAGALAASMGSGDTARTVRWGSASIEGTLDATRMVDGRASATGTVTAGVRSLALRDGASLPDPVDASIADFSYRGTLDATAGATVAPGLGFEGLASLSDLKVALTHERVGPATLASARIAHEGAGRARGATPTDPALVQLNGRAEGERLQLETPELDRVKLEVAKWNAEALSLDSTKSAASIDTLAVTGAKSSLARALLPRGAAAGAATEGVPPAAQESAPASGPFERHRLIDLKLAHLRLDDATLDVTDLSTEPPTRHSITRVKAEIDNLSTREPAPTSMTAEGIVNDSARFEARGSLDPFDLERETTIDFTLTSLALKPYDPYAGRFVGYEIESGRLTLKLPVAIHQSKLDGTLDATLDRFYLGREVPSKEALDLPIKLGLDLLRDSKERIAVNIPFSGDLRDPQFELGGVVWQAIVNLLLKATTAPFTLLGSLVGAGDRDLSQVVFEPGSAELSPEAAADLDLLAKALAERPAIGVRAMGMVIESIDLEGLRVTALRERITAEARLKPGEKLSPQDYERAVSRAFRDLPRAQREPVEREASGGSPKLAAMERAVAASIEVDPAAVAALAQARADAVVKALVQTGLAAERIGAESGGEVAEGPPRVSFELR